MKIIVRLEVGLGPFVVFRVDLVNPCGRPQSTIDLQMQQIRNGSPLTYEGLLP
jgi:hypothetical protein